MSASSHATRRRGTGLDGKTSDIDLPSMVPLLPENDDSGAVNEIAPPQALRFAEQSKRPFEARALHPPGRAALRPGKALPRCTHTQAHAARAAALSHFRARRLDGSGRSVSER